MLPFYCKESPVWLNSYFRHIILAHLPLHNFLRGSSEIRVHFNWHVTSEVPSLSLILEQTDIFSLSIRFREDVRGERIVVIILKPLK